MEVIRKEVCQRTDPVLCWLQVAISNTGCRLVSEKCINASSSYYTDPFMEIRWKRKCLLEETKRSRQEVRGARCEVRSAKLPNVVSHPSGRISRRPFEATRGQFPYADNVSLVNSDHRTKQTPMGRASLVSLAEPRPLYHAEAPCGQGSPEKGVQRPHQASSHTEPD